MKIQKWGAVLLGAALATSLAACSGSATGNETKSDSASSVASHPSFPAGSTMAKLAKAGTVRIGVKFDQPPYGSKDLSGKEQGFDVDIAKAIAGGLGIAPDKIQWVETVAANREPFLQQGKVDFIVAAYGITDSRKQVVSFAGPYFNDPQDLAVKKGNPENIKGPKDTAGKKVCAITGSAVAQEMREHYPKAQLVQFDVQTKCAAALKDGSVDAWTSDTGNIWGAMAKDPSAFDLVGKPFRDDLYAVGIPKGDTQFCGYIEKTIKKLESDGSYKKAWNENIKTLLDKIGLKDSSMPTPPSLQSCTALTK